MYGLEDGQQYLQMNISCFNTWVWTLNGQYRVRNDTYYYSCYLLNRLRQLVEASNSLGIFLIVCIWCLNFSSSREYARRGHVFTYNKYYLYSRKNQSLVKFLCLIWKKLLKLHIYEVLVYFIILFNIFECKLNIRSFVHTPNCWPSKGHNFSGCNIKSQNVA